MLKPANALQEILQQLATGPAVIIAGGTDYYPALGDRPPPQNTVDISQAPELQKIEFINGTLRIGAGVTWTQLIHAKLPAALDALRSAGESVGSIQIQNAATVVGNICNASPAADGVPPLLALDAKIELTSASSTRVLPLDQFICGVRKTARRTDELVTAIHIPSIDNAAKSYFYKLGSRSYLVISIAMIALNMTLDESGRIINIRIAVGSCSAVAQRLTALETALTNQRLQADNISALIVTEHLSCLTPIDDIRGTKTYRLQAVREILGRMLTLGTTELKQI